MCVIVEGQQATKPQVDHIIIYSKELE